MTEEICRVAVGADMSPVGCGDKVFDDGDSVGDESFEKIYRLAQPMERDHAVCLGVNAVVLDVQETSDVSEQFSQQNSSNELCTGNGEGLQW